MTVDILGRLFVVVRRLRRLRPYSGRVVSIGDAASFAAAAITQARAVESPNPLLFHVVTDVLHDMPKADLMLHLREARAGVSRIRRRCIEFLRRHAVKYDACGALEGVIEVAEDHVGEGYLVGNAHFVEAPKNEGEKV